MFQHFQSPEYYIMKEVFHAKNMEQYLAHIVEEFIYQNVKTYHNNGQIKEEYRTKYGVKDGEYKRRYRNGHPEGMPLQEHPEGMPLRGQLEIQITDVDGIKHGECKQWNENGKLYSQTTYVDGKEHGEYKEWRDNGQLWIQITFVDGKEHGEYKEWHENGQVMLETTYVDGKIHGQYKEWNDNGDLLRHTRYVDDIEIH